MVGIGQMFEGSLEVYKLLSAAESLGIIVDST